MLLDIRSDHLALVKGILQRWVPGLEVWAFGSRAKWTAKDYSDLDLCIVTQAPLAFEVMGHMQEAFAESDLPYKVDLVDWSSVSASFRKVIERDKVGVQAGNKALDWGMSSETALFGSLFSTPQKNGLTRPKAVRGAGIPMVNMGELFAYPRIEDLVMDLVAVSDGEAHFLLEPEDLLFARQSLVLEGAGQCSIFVGNKKPTVFESHLIRCRLNKSIANPYFYFYFFRSPAGRTAIETIAEQGAGASGIRGSDLVKLAVPCPPKERQDAVAAVLTVLDDRIALLRETNATLEAIAQALFKSWFVDFDPVRAKAEGRAPVGMDEATAALFPDGFEESELGLIPRGWRVSTLVDAFEVNPTRKLTKGSMASYLDMASLATSGHCVEAPVHREMGSGSKFRNGDTLLARITPCLENGKSAFVDFLEEGQTGWGSTEFLVLRPKAPLPEYFGYLLCRHPAFRDYAIQSMSGTSGRQRIQNDVLGRYFLAVPGFEIASVFASVVEPIQRSIAANHQSAQTLATLRDTLLPRLISGQLRLPEAEATLEDAFA